MQIDTSLGYLDIVALIGFWSVWQLIFVTAQPLGWLRKKIYDRWPPDGHWFVDPEAVPERRISKLERTVMKNGFSMPELIKRRPYLTTPETLHSPQMAAWKKDGSITKATVSVSNLDDTQTTIETPELRSVTIKVWMVRQGDGNVVTNAFSCLQCSPVWVFICATPAFLLVRPAALWVGSVGFALMAGRLIMQGASR